ncbi:MAG TPA: radical SAM/SPASM domain-containing protein [Pseudonocardiaceae bacterium]
MDASVRDSSRELRFLWLEITGHCQLLCEHCYAEGGPAGTDGVMTGDDWRRVIDQAVALGVRLIQFIGGEPTMHPELPQLVGYVLRQQVGVEVFTNLVRVTPRLWDTFSQPGVRLATSYYSDSADQHTAIVGRRGVHARTTSNIAEAVRRAIPLRVGIVDIMDGQRVKQARELLTALGVSDIGTDHLRQVGRGVSTDAPDASQLCGNCARGKVAIAPTGDVWPCVFARWMPVGNVRTASLAEIVTGTQMAQTVARLDAHFEPLAPEMVCLPRMCDPDCGPNCGPACLPSCWPHGTGPCGPNGGCVPNYG